MARRRNNRRRNNNRQGGGNRRATAVVVPAAAVRTRRRRRTRRQGRRQGGVMATIGEAAGSFFGPAAQRVGRMAGSAIGRIFGSGAYQVTNGVGSNTLAGTSPPSFGSLTAATRVRHREFISDIVATTDFTVRSYPLAPGVGTLFPWLSRIAANYEQYRIMGLVIEYKATSANALNSTNTGLGVVGIATQYDANEPDFVSKQEAENYVGSQSCSPAVSLLHFVECAQGQNPLNTLYVRTGELGSDQDLKFYDMGKVQLFTAGMQSAVAVIGELWVSYDIEFSKPKLPAGGFAAVNYMDYYRQLSIGTGNVNMSGMINNARREPIVGMLGSYLVNNAVEMPPHTPVGNYICLIIQHYVSGSGTNASPTAFVNLANVTAYNFFNNGTQSTMFSAAGNVFLAGFAFRKSSSSSTGSFTVTVTWQGSNNTNVSNLDIFVFPAPVISELSKKKLDMNSIMAKLDALTEQYGLLLQQRAPQPASEIDIAPSHDVLD